jgi:hypothetical protein
LVRQTPAPRPPEKLKIGKLLLFSNFHKHLTAPRPGLPDFAGVIALLSRCRKLVGGQLSIFVGSASPRRRFPRLQAITLSHSRTSRLYR